MTLTIFSRTPRRTAAEDREVLGEHTPAGRRSCRVPGHDPVAVRTRALQAEVVRTVRANRVRRRNPRSISHSMRSRASSCPSSAACRYRAVHPRSQRSPGAGRGRPVACGRGQIRGRFSRLGAHDLHGSSVNSDLYTAVTDVCARIGWPMPQVVERTGSTNADLVGVAGHGHQAGGAGNRLPGGVVWTVRGSAGPGTD